MKRRILSILCVLALCLTILPVTALADDTLVATVESGGTKTEYYVGANYSTAEAAWSDCQNKTATLTLY